jgi:hypothetical protein
MPLIGSRIELMAGISEAQQMATQWNVERTLFPGFFLFLVQKPVEQHSFGQMLSSEQHVTESVSSVFTVALVESFVLHFPPLQQSLDLVEDPSLPNESPPQQSPPVLVDLGSVPALHAFFEQQF